MNFQSGLFVSALFLSVSVTRVQTDRTNENPTCSKPVVAERGRFVNLAPTLKTFLASHATNSSCYVRALASDWTRCGTIRPDVFSCSYVFESNSTIRYDHFGCFGNKESIRFQVSRGGNVSRLQIVAKVVDSSHRLATVKNSLKVSLTPHGDGGRLFKVQFLFSPEWREACFYAVAIFPGVLPLPQYGEIEGPINKLFSCGFAPKESFIYVQRTAGLRKLDHIIVIFTQDYPTNQQRLLLPLETTADREYEKVKQFPEIEISVHHTALTPILLGGFIKALPGDYLKVHIEGGGGVFVNDGLIQMPSGACVPELSVFAMDDVWDHSVAFHPTNQHITNNNGNNASSQFNVRVFDPSGQLLAVSTLRVKFDPLLQIVPLTLIMHGNTFEDLHVPLLRSVSVLQLNSTCTHQFRYNSDRGFFGGIEQTIDSPYLEISHSNLMSTPLSYHQRTSLSYLYDCFEWTIFCKDPSLLLKMTVYLVRISPGASQPRLDFSIRSLDVSTLFITQLNGLMIQASDFDESNWNIKYTVDNGQIILIPSVSEIRDPFIPASSLLQNVSLENEFTQEHLDKGMVWYIPPWSPNNATTNITLHLQGANDTSTVAIAVSVLSTPKSNQLEAIFEWVEMHPLHLTPLAQRGEITPKHIKSAESEDNYLVVYGPVWGHICSTGLQLCEKSSTMFSQSEINNGSVHYVASGAEFEVDAFAFTTPNSVSSSLHWFVIRKASTPEEVAAKKTTHSLVPDVTVQQGGNVSLPLSVIPEDIRLLPFSNVHIVSPPQYGNLSATDMFTRDELEKGSILYKHGGKPFCLDEILLALEMDNIIVGVILVQIVFQTSETDLSVPPVTITNKTFHVPSVAFSLLDIFIVTPHCETETLAHVKVLPQYGNIVFGVPDNSNQTRFFQPGGQFSLDDLVKGNIGYELRAEFISSSVIDSFSFSIPSLSNSAEYTVVLSYSQAANMQYDIIINPQSPIYGTEIRNGLYGFRLNKSSLGINVSPKPSPKATLACLTYSHRFNLYRHNPEEGTDDLQEKNCFPVEDLARTDYWLELDHVDRNDNNATSDILGVQVSVYHSANGPMRTSNRVNITMRWSFVYFQKREITIAEKTNPIFEVSLRREGWGGIEAAFEVVSAGGNATNNCSGNIFADVCAENTTVVMAAGMYEAVYKFELFSDDLIEGTEILVLEIVHSSNSIPLLGMDKVYIHVKDSFPESTMLRFDVPGSQPSSDPACDAEITVPEDMGILSLPVLRTGPHLETVGVICYTKDTTVNREKDYIPRANDPDSLLLLDQNVSSVPCPVSIINDHFHEFRETFVAVLGDTIGNTLVDTSGDRICVHISNDLTEESSVGFAVASLTVTVTATVTVPQFVTVSLIRTGSPSSLATPTTVHMAPSNSSNHTAVDGLHYFIPGEVEFTANKNSTVLNIILLSVDSIKSFQIEITSVENGTRAKDGQQLTVFLVPGQKPVIEFSTQRYEMKENGSISITVVRHGNLNIESTFKCIQHSEEAIVDQDFHSNVQETVVTMGINESVAFCTLRGIDDDVWEGPENLRYSLRPSDGYSLLGQKSEVNIKLVDPEDIPTVQLSSRKVVEKEPLSNFGVDARSVTVWLIRSGDPRERFLIEYFTEDGNGTSPGLGGADYEPVKNTVLFEPYVMNLSVGIRLISNHQKQQDFQFFVKIRRVPATEFPLLGKNSTTSVEVSNHRLKGVFFPDEPRVVGSSSHTSDANTVSSYKPLLCLTPCDPEWEGDPILKEECKNQGIAPELTKYTWELNLEHGDGNTFRQIEFSNILVSPHSRHLDPAYMFRDRFVRCKATAVDVNNVPGYTRVSRAVRLVHVSEEACSESDNLSTLKVSGALTHPSEDIISLDSIVKLTLFKIPHFDNQILLLSTRQFPNDVTTLLTFWPSRRSHQCSNFVDDSFHSLTGAEVGRHDRPLSVYKQLDYVRCQWTFESHHKIRDIIDVCGGTLDQKGGLTTIKVPIYLTYAHVSPWDVIPTRPYSANTTVSLTIPSHLFTNRSLPTPVKKIVNSAYNASLKLVSVAEEDGLQIIFETSLNDSRRWYFVDVWRSYHSEVRTQFGGLFDLKLLQSSRPERSTRYQPNQSSIILQMWQISAKTKLDDYSGEYLLELVQCELLFGEFCTDTRKITFRFQIEKEKNGNGYMPGIVVGTVQSEPSKREYEIGETINITLVPDNGQQLSHGVGIRVIDADLCQNRAQGERTCSPQNSIKSSSLTGRTVRSTRNVLTSVHTLQLPTVMLSEGKWYIDIRYVIVKDNQVLFDGPNGEGFVKSDSFTLHAEDNSPSVGGIVGEDDRSPVIVASSLSLSAAALLAMVCVVMVIILCLIRKKCKQRLVSAPVSRNQSNVKVHYHGVATRVTLEGGVEKVECHFEVVRIPPEASSLPDTNVLYQRFHQQRSTDSVEEVSSSTQSHRSLPAPLPWAGSETVHQEAKYNSVFRIDRESEMGSQMVAITESFLAAMAPSPKDSNVKEETSV